MTCRCKVVLKTPGRSNWCGGPTFTCPVEFWDLESSLCWLLPLCPRWEMPSTGGSLHLFRSADYYMMNCFLIIFCPASSLIVLKDRFHMCVNKVNGGCNRSSWSLLVRLNQNIPLPRLREETQGILYKNTNFESYTLCLTHTAEVSYLAEQWNRTSWPVWTGGMITYIHVHTVRHV